MTIMTDQEIEALCKDQGPARLPIITPFQNFLTRKWNDKPVISWGLSSAGYDVRLGYDFLFPAPNEMDSGPWQPGEHPYIDPKNLSTRIFEPRHCEQVCHLPPHSFCLGTTLETFRMPNDVVALCTGKSTYARCGILVTPTPFEPGWVGEATLEITNVTDYPAIIYCGEGIVQVQFHKLNGRPVTTYADRQGKYQDQKGVTPAKV